MPTPDFETYVGKLDGEETHDLVVYALQQLPTEGAIHAILEAFEGTDREAELLAMLEARDVRDDETVPPVIVTGGDE